MKQMEKGPWKPQEKELSESAKRLLRELEKNPKLTLTQLSYRLETSTATLSRLMKPLKDQGILRRVGSRKAGSWEVHL